MFFLAMMQEERGYKALRFLGRKPEQARAVLPNALKANIIMIANIRDGGMSFG